MGYLIPCFQAIDWYHLITLGSKVNKTVEAHLVINTYQLTFHDFPSSLRPSLHFVTKVSELLLSLYSCRSCFHEARSWTSLFHSLGSLDTTESPWARRIEHTWLCLRSIREHWTRPRPQLWRHQCPRTGTSTLSLSYELKWRCFLFGWVFILIHNTWNVGPAGKSGIRRFRCA